MPKLPVVSSTKVISVARKLGFELVRQKGSHLILKNKDKILKILGLSKEEFTEMLLVCLISRIFLETFLNNKINKLVVILFNGG